MVQRNDDFFRPILRRARERQKTIHKSWVGFGTGLRAVMTDLSIVLQLLVLATGYALLARFFPVFFYVSLALTACCAVYVLICEPDPQSAISWILLFIISFGSGYIVYILASKPVCYGADRLRYKKIYRRSAEYVAVHAEDIPAEISDVSEYAFKKGGCVSYRNSRIEYMPNARDALNSIIDGIEHAEKFVFIEFFIVADGELFDRLVHVCRRKTAEGVKIYMLYDDVGSAGVLSSYAKNSLKAAGVNMKAFKKLFTLFNFGLNFRDHRKIVVIDGKTGYIGGYNFIDDCANLRKMEGVWKDSGARIQGEAVDGLALQFIRQWEFATREKLDYAEFTGLYEKFENGSVVAPYTAGPENKEALCRGVYEKIIEGAKEKLYIMTPYLVPDGGIMKMLRKKAKAGVDVRLVLPGVPDYGYIYRVTKSNAQRLQKCGVKIYYAHKVFVHSKVMLTEKCLAVGSVNLDMRAFYQEFDNGVFTDDLTARRQAAEDFGYFFKNNSPSEEIIKNPLTLLISGILRIVSPLM